MSRVREKFRKSVTSHILIARAFIFQAPFVLSNQHPIQQKNPVCLSHDLTTLSLQPVQFSAPISYFLPRLEHSSMIAMTTTPTSLDFLIEMHFLHAEGFSAAVFGYRMNSVLQNKGKTFWMTVAFGKDAENLMVDEPMSIMKIGTIVSRFQGCKFQNMSRYFYKKCQSLLCHLSLVA